MAGRRDNAAMKVRKILLVAVGVALFVLAWRAYRWPGIAMASGGIVMWVLLNFTRTVTIMQRAAAQPIGHVPSAVMLNVKLKPRVSLLHTVALTRALGESLSAEGAQPEVYRWTDAGGSHVTCEFDDGRLARWQLVRPEPDRAPAAALAAADTATT